LEDPEDVKTREEIARLNAEIIHASADTPTDITDDDVD
jgi:hypothetical protein